MNNMLEIKNLKVKVEDKEILKGLSMKIGKGEVHALMGPNGSGKSTLAQSIMGHPKYDVFSGKVLFNGKDLLKLDVSERAKEGVFLAFQYPSEVSGITVANFLRLVYNNFAAARDEKGLSPVAFRKVLKEKMAFLKIDESFAERYLNEGFSGGEKKRCEILQMAVVSPKLAILDETDSGLDIDALRVVSEGVNRLRKETGLSVLVITHYTRVLKYIKPDFVHVMKDGVIVKEGGHDLAEELEVKGYALLES